MRLGPRRQLPVRYFMLLEAQDGDISVKCEVLGEWVDVVDTNVVVGIAFLAYYFLRGRITFRGFSCVAVIGPSCR